MGWLGDFTRGALHFDDGTKVEGKREWHKKTDTYITGTTLTKEPNTPSCCTGVPRNQTVIGKQSLNERSTSERKDSKYRIP